MAVIGYIRVSTDKQDEEGQRYGIKTFVQAKGYSSVKLLAEHASGKTSWKERELSRIVDALEEGDTLIVTELSRLGRSLLDVMEIMAILTRKKIVVYSIKENFCLDEGIASKVIIFAFSLASEIERQLISARTKEALAAKKASGVILGRRGKDRKPRSRSCQKRGVAPDGTLIS